MSRLSLTPGVSWSRASSSWPVAQQAQLKESSSRPPSDLERVPEAASSRDTQDQGHLSAPMTSCRRARARFPGLPSRWGPGDHGPWEGSGRGAGSRCQDAGTLEGPPHLGLPSTGSQCGGGAPDEEQRTALTQSGLWASQWLGESFPSAGWGAQGSEKAREGAVRLTPHVALGSGCPFPQPPAAASPARLCPRPARRPSRTGWAGQVSARVLGALLV